jgi:hypothetical protein
MYIAINGKIEVLRYLAATAYSANCFLHYCIAAYYRYDSEDFLHSCYSNNYPQSGQYMYIILYSIPVSI